MQQRTHSWIAIRAIALLEDEGDEKGLVRLLKPHARMSSVGAWIPDMADAKRAGNAIDNHVLKMQPMSRRDPRFVMVRDDLVKALGKHRRLAQYLDGNAKPSATWWSKAYKGDVDTPGQHLPNRAMALGTMLRDLLIMGDRKVDELVPGAVRFAQYLDDRIRTREEAAATFFFMLSHFVADCGMPMHCDHRKICAYSNGMHKEWEGHWNRIVGTFFEKQNLVEPAPNLSAVQDANLVLRTAKEVDAKFNLGFAAAPVVPPLGKDHDIWLEMMMVCRGSFALTNIIARESDYPFDDTVKTVDFATILPSALRAELDRVVIHDAVLNTAIVWKSLWKQVSKH